VNELKIINSELQKAINILFNRAKERISEIKIVNKVNHEVEATFNGPKWETTNYLSITEDTIKDPDRDCDCRTGSNMGFCPHFWIAFLKSLQLGFFALEDWTLTQLPYHFKKALPTFIHKL